MSHLTENKQTMTYLNIIDGKIAQKSTKEDGGVERIKKDNTTTWEKYFKSVTGKITSITLKDSQFGQQVLVLIDNDTLLQFGLETRYASSFLTKNVPLNEEVTLSPYNFESEGKKQVGISVNKGNEKIMSDWSSVPPLIEKKKGGKVVYDNTDRINYFIEKLSKSNSTTQDEPAF